MYITVLLLCICPVPIGGLSLLNENGGLKVFFPRNSFVTNTTLTRTNRPRGMGGVVGNDHIVCCGHHPEAAQVTWHNRSGRLVVCLWMNHPAPCHDCGPLCQRNGAVGVDPPLNGSTDIHMYTDSTAYKNQDLECQVSGRSSAFIGVYLKSGSELVVLHSIPTVHVISTWDLVPVTLDDINYIADM